MKINKQFLQILAAIWILLFHLWICVSGTGPEQFILKIGYVGVDLFFFLSAYSLADREINYLSFLKNRFGSVYLRFAVFVIAASVYKGWTFIRMLKTLSFISFFESGGGSFLWFIPAIMIFYLVYPLFLRWRGEWKIGIVLMIWFGCSLMLDNMTGYSKVFIFTNRIPVIMVGYFLKKHEIEKFLPGMKKFTQAIICVLLPASLWILYQWGYKHKLNWPFADFFYIIAIPIVICIAYLSNLFPEKKWVNLFASSTLEIYAIQMIWGSAVVTCFYKLTHSAWITNLCMFVIVIGSSVMVSVVYKLVVSKLAVYKLLNRVFRKNEIVRKN